MNGRDDQTTQEDAVEMEVAGSAEGAGGHHDGDGRDDGAAGGDDVAASVKAASGPVEPGHEATPVTIACGCLRGRKDASVIAEPRYNWWATATLLFGISAAPRCVEYQCLKCRKVIATETDPATIRKFMHH